MLVPTALTCSGTSRSTLTGSGEVRDVTSGRAWRRKLQEGGHRAVTLSRVARVGARVIFANRDLRVHTLSFRLPRATCFRGYFLPSRPQLYPASNSVDMDDNLELPTSISKSDAAVVQEEEEQSSGDEDQGPDWTKIP